MNDERRRRTSFAGGTGNNNSGIIATATTPFKAAANLFADTVKWGFGLRKSPTASPSNQLSNEIINAGNPVGLSAKETPSGQVQSPDKRGLHKEADAHILEQQSKVHDSEGPQKTKNQPGFNEPTTSSLARNFDLNSSPYPADLGGRQLLAKPVLTVDNEGGYRGSNDAYLSPYQGRGTPVLQNKAFLQKTDRYIAKGDLHSTGQDALQRTKLHTSNRQYQSPRNPYENVRAILRQRRSHASVLDRYKGQGNDNLQGGDSQGVMDKRHSSYFAHSQRRQSFDTAMHAHTMITQRKDLHSDTDHRSDMTGIEQKDVQPKDLVAHSSAQTPPVHAFQKPQWTPMRPSSSAARYKTLKRSHSTISPDKGLSFESPRKMQVREWQKVSKVVTPNEVKTPSSQDMKSNERIPSSQKDQTLTTETAKRILSTLDSLTSAGESSAPLQKEFMPQKLKFDVPSVSDIPVNKPPPIETLRHFSETKKEKPAAVVVQKSEGEPKKQWPTSFLKKNRSQSDAAIEGVKKEIESASKGMGMEKKAEGTVPSFVFGNTTVAPISPIFGVQSNEKAAKVSKPKRDIVKSFTFTSNDTSQNAEIPVSKGQGERTFIFGTSELNESEKAIQKAISNASSNGIPSTRDFIFGGNLQAKADSLKQANTTAIKAAAQPLPSAPDFDSEKKPESSKVTSAPQKWPSSFLSKNKRQAEEATSAVEEEIKKAKGESGPEKKLSMTGSASVFNFSTSTDVPKVDFGFKPSLPESKSSLSQSDSKSPSLFTFGSSQSTASQPANSVFKFGDAKETSLPSSETKASFVFGFSKDDKGTTDAKDGASIGKADVQSGEQTKESTPKIAFQASSNFVAGSLSAGIKPVFGTVGGGTFTFGGVPDKSKDLDSGKEENKADVLKDSSTASTLKFGESNQSPSFGTSQSSFGAGQTALSTPSFFQQASATDKPEEEKGGQSNTSASTGNIFSFSSSTTSTAQGAGDKNSTSIFTFGASSGNNKEVGSSDVFSKGSGFQMSAPQSSSEALPSSNISGSTPFVFGSASSSSSQQGSTFGGSNTFGNSSSPFSLGSASAQSNSIGSAPSEPAVFTFGASKPAPSSQASTTGFQAAPPFSTQATSFSSGFTFGASSQAFSNGNEGTAPAFGSNVGFQSTASFGASSGPAFGTSVPSSPAPVFGSNVAPSASQSFGAGMPSSSAPVFGSSTPMSPAPVFGSSAPPSSTPVFGSTAPPSSAPAFGSSAPQGSAPVFGSSMPQGSAPVFGSGAPQGASPAFGSSAPQGSGFGFGGSSLGGSTGGFSMGVGPTGQQQHGRRKVKAKPSWRKK